MNYMVSYLHIHDMHNFRYQGVGLGLHIRKGVDHGLQVRKGVRPDQG